MTGKYIRISDRSQNIDRQLNTTDKLYIDVVSGKTPFTSRPQAQQLIKDIINKKITLLKVNEISRLGRDLLDVISALSFLHENGVTIFVENIGMYSMIEGKENPAFKMVITILVNIAETEYNSIKERQAEGIKTAMARGKYFGRLKGSSMSSKERCEANNDIVKYFNKNKRNPVTKYSYRDIAKLTGKNLSTVQRVAKAYEELGSRAVYAGDPFGASASPVLKR